MKKKFYYDIIDNFELLEFYLEGDERTGEIFLNKELVKEYLEAKEKFEKFHQHLMVLILEEENRSWH